MLQFLSTFKLQPLEIKLPLVLIKCLVISIFPFALKVPSVLFISLPIIIVPFALKVPLFLKSCPVEIFPPVELNVPKLEILFPVVIFAEELITPLVLDVKSFAIFISCPLWLKTPDPTILKLLFKFVEVMGASNETPAALETLTSSKTNDGYEVLIT